MNKNRWSEFRVVKGNCYKGVWQFDLEGYRRSVRLENIGLRIKVCGLIKQKYAKVIVTLMVLVFLQ